jgi:ATP-dependent DNA helicase RecQ
LRHPDLVPDFARRLADVLRLPFHPALRKVRDTPPQKTMENGVHQSRNVADAFAAVTDEVRPGPVLLVDDLVDSRWTLTECARVLRAAGSGPVHPFALATSGGDDE